MPLAWGDPWLGGRTYRDGRRTVYVLERMRSGKRYTIKLDARDEEEAERELAKFDRDPAGYQRPRPVASSGEFAMTAERIQAVLTWQANEGESREHRQATKRYLTQWALKLSGRDMNTLTVDDLERLLTEMGAKARRNRIVALKTFSTYHARSDLRTNTAARLSVPQYTPAKNFNPRHYQRHEVERAYAETATQPQRDTIRVCLMAGLHVSEVERFAKGEGRLVAIHGQGKIAGVLWVLHKRGEQHPVSLDAATFAAALRLRERKCVPTRTNRKLVARRVAERLRKKNHEGVRPVTYGSLRHTFVTWARSAGGRIISPKHAGVSLEEIREAVGHRSTKTTRIYDGTEIPPMITFPVTLRHPSDPKPGKRRR